MFPEVDFFLVDSIGKKIKVVEGVAGALGLKNVIARQLRVETMKEKFDFIVSRAVTAFPAFVALTKKRIRENSFNDLSNGILYLKGGDLKKRFGILRIKFLFIIFLIFLRKSFLKRRN